MSTCSRCGAQFSCAMADPDGSNAPCWCAALPTVVPVPGVPGAACWCPTCLRAHIAQQTDDTAPLKPA